MPRSNRASSGSSSRAIGGRALVGGGHARFEVDEQVDQGLAHQGVAVDAVTELATAGRVDGRLEERAAVDAQSHERHAEAAAVDHLHHAVDAPPIAGGVGRRRAVPGVPASQARAPSRVTSPVGTPTVPELGLQALDDEAVRRPVGEVAGDDEGGEATAAGRGTLGPGQDDEDVGVDVGAEVLVAESSHSSPSCTARVVLAPTSLPPWRSVRNIPPSQACRRDRGCAAGPGSRRPTGVGGVALDDVGRTARHAQAAVDGRLGLGHQVGHGRAVTTAGHGTPGIGLEADEPVAHQVGLVLESRLVVDDLVDLVPPAVVAAQDRPVLVGLLGPGGDDLAHQGSERRHVLLGEGAVGRVGEVAVEQEGQVGVEGVPVEADGLLELGVVGKHRPDATPSAGPRGSGRAGDTFVSKTN